MANTGEVSPNLVQAHCSTTVSSSNDDLNKSPRSLTRIPGTENSGERGGTVDSVLFENSSGSPVHPANWKLTGQNVSLSGNRKDSLIHSSSTNGFHKKRSARPNRIPSREIYNRGPSQFTLGSFHGNHHQSIERASSSDYPAAESLRNSSDNSSNNATADSLGQEPEVTSCLPCLMPDGSSGSPNPYLESKRAVKHLYSLVSSDFPSLTDKFDKNSLKNTMHTSEVSDMSELKRSFKFGSLKSAVSVGNTKFAPDSELRAGDDHSGDISDHPLPVGSFIQPSTNSGQIPAKGKWDKQESSVISVLANDTVDRSAGRGFYDLESELSVEPVGRVNPFSPGYDHLAEQSLSYLSLVNSNVGGPSQTGAGRSSEAGRRPSLSGEEAQRVPFLRVGRKKDFIHIEKIKGKSVNILQGLELHTQVFDAAEQKRIVDYIYSLQELGQQGKLRDRTYSEPKKWLRGKGRVTIQFGCCYNYAVDKYGNPPGIIQDEEVDPIPPLFKTIIRRLVRWHVLPPICIPNSCIVNIYEEGDCIPPHIDHHDFVRPFCTVSFLSECNIVFGLNLKIEGPGEFSGPVRIPLPVGSLLVLNGNGADVAKHCVPSVPTKRISITFRKMDDSKLPYKFTHDPDLEGLKPYPSSYSSVQSSLSDVTLDTQRNVHTRGGNESCQGEMFNVNDFPPLAAGSESGRRKPVALRQ